VSHVSSLTPLQRSAHELSAARALSLALLLLCVTLSAPLGAQPAGDSAGFPVEGDEGGFPTEEEQAPSQGSEEGSPAQKGAPTPQEGAKPGAEFSPEPSAQAKDGEPAQAPEAEGARREVTGEKALPNERAVIRRRAPSRLGATGLAEVLSADTGPQGTLRLSLQLGGFRSEEFLTPGVEERFVGTRANFAYTPHELVELFLSARSLSHTNPATSPTTIQSQGDLNIGAKSGRFWGHFGAAFALDLQTYSAPDGWWDLGATSVNLHGLLSYDLARGESPIPFRFLFHSQYTVERSEALFSELPELPNLVQEWAYQAGYYNRLHLRFGLEVPLEYVSPFIEYHIGTPFEVEMPRMGKFSRVFAFESVPQHVNLGLRGFIMEHLSADLVASLGMSDAPFTGVPATPPWSLWGGLSYTLDPRPEVIEREVTVTPPKPKLPEPKPLGTLLSLTITNPQGQVIKGATLRYLELPDKAPQLSDERGLISGYRLKAGRVLIELSAEGYLTRRVALKIKPQQEALKGKIKLKEDPQQRAGTLQVTLSAQALGEPDSELPEALQGAQLSLSLHGPERYTGELSFGGEPSRFSVKPGEYALSLSLAGELRYHSLVTIGAGGELKRVISPSDLIGESAEGSGEAKPKGKKASKGSKKAKRSKRSKQKKTKRGSAKRGSSASYDKQRGLIKTRGSVSFKGDGAQLSAQGLKLVDAVGALLKSTRSIKSVTIQVHTHSVGSRDGDRALGQKRGEAIKARLQKAGVASARLKVKSFGSSQSIASNITSSGRRKNQRVTFKAQP